MIFRADRATVCVHVFDEGTDFPDDFARISWLNATFVSKDCECLSINSARVGGGALVEGNAKVVVRSERECDGNEN